MKRFILGIFIIMICITTVKGVTYPEGAVKDISLGRYHSITYLYTPYLYTGNILGFGYTIGDNLTIDSGNHDAILEVTGVDNLINPIIQSVPYTGIYEGVTRLTDVNNSDTMSIAQKFTALTTFNLSSIDVYIGTSGWTAPAGCGITMYIYNNSDLSNNSKVGETSEELHEYYLPVLLPTCVTYNFILYNSTKLIEGHDYWYVLVARSTNYGYDPPWSMTGWTCGSDTMYSCYVNGSGYYTYNNSGWISQPFSAVYQIYGVNTTRISSYTVTNPGSNYSIGSNLNPDSNIQHFFVDKGGEIGFFENENFYYINLTGGTGGGAQVDIASVYYNDSCINSTSYKFGTCTEGQCFDFDRVCDYGCYNDNTCYTMPPFPSLPSPITDSCFSSNANDKLFFHFNNESYFGENDTFARDYSIYGQNLVLGQVKYVSGKYGYAIQASANTSFLTLTDPNFLSYASDINFCFWLNFSDTGDVITITYGDTNATGHLFLSFTPTIYSLSDGGEYNRGGFMRANVNGNHNIPLNDWHLACFSSGSETISLDGVNIDSGGRSLNGYSTIRNSTFTVTGTTGTSIDEFKLWTTGGSYSDPPCPCQSPNNLSCTNYCAGGNILQISYPAQCNNNLGGCNYTGTSCTLNNCSGDIFNTGYCYGGACGIIETNCTYGCNADTSIPQCCTAPPFPDLPSYLTDNCLTCDTTNKLFMHFNDVGVFGENDTFARDYSIYNHLTTLGNITYTSSNYDNGLIALSDTNFVTLPYPNLMISASSHNASFCMWYMLSDPTNNISFNYGNSTVYMNGFINGTVVSIGASTRGIFIENYFTPINTWNSVCWRFSDSSKLLVLSINGAEIISNGDAYVAGMPTIINTTLIVSGTNGSAIDELKVWDRFIGDNEYNSPCPCQNSSCTAICNGNALEICGQCNNNYGNYSITPYNCDPTCVSCNPYCSGVGNSELFTSGYCSFSDNQCHYALDQICRFGCVGTTCYAPPSLVVAGESCYATDPNLYLSLHFDNRSVDGDTATNLRDYSIYNNSVTVADSGYTSSSLYTHNEVIGSSGFGGEVIGSSGFGGLVVDWVGVYKISPNPPTVDCVSNVCSIYSTEDLIDYPVRLLTTGLTGNLAITDGLPYFNDTPNSVWVPINISIGQNLTIIISNSGGYASDGTSVFSLFDDFNGDALNPDLWTNTIADVPATISGGKLFVTSSGDDYIDQVESNILFSQGYGMVVRAYDSTGDNTFHRKAFGFAVPNSPLSYGTSISIDGDDYLLFSNVTEYLLYLSNYTATPFHIYSIERINDTHTRITQDYGTLDSGDNYDTLTNDSKSIGFFSKNGGYYVNNAMGNGYVFIPQTNNYVIDSITFDAHTTISNYCIMDSSDNIVLTANAGDSALGWRPDVGETYRILVGCDAASYTSYYGAETFPIESSDLNIVSGYHNGQDYGNGYDIGMITLLYDDTTIKNIMLGYTPLDLTNLYSYTPGVYYGNSRVQSDLAHDYIGPGEGYTNVIINSSTTAVGDGSTTYCMWLKFQDELSSFIFARGTDHEIGIGYYDGEGGYVKEFSAETGEGAGVTSSLDSIDVTQWNYYCAVFDYYTPSISTYVNGIFLGNTGGSCMCGC